MKRTGVAAMATLVGCESAGEETKVVKFANTFKHLLFEIQDEVLLSGVATSLGLLARKSVALGNNDVVKFELNRGLEWLLAADPGASHRRLAACLVLSQLAAATPSLFFVKVAVCPSLYLDLSLRHSGLWTECATPRGAARSKAFGWYCSSHTGLVEHPWAGGRFPLAEQISSPRAPSLPPSSPLSFASLPTRPAQSADFFGRIWPVLRDARQSVREAAAVALGAALAVLAQRPSPRHLVHYFRCYEQVGGPPPLTFFFSHCTLSLVFTTC